MNNFFKVALTSLTTLTLACGLVQAQDGPTPEEAEFVYRDSLFRVIAYKSSQLPAAKAAGDTATFQATATDIAVLADMITDGFQIENNIPENSLALPAIWEDFDNFAEKAHDLRTAAQALAAPGGMDSYDPRGFGGQSCGGCHRDHKARAN